MKTPARITAYSELEKSWSGLVSNEETVFRGFERKSKETSKKKGKATHIDAIEVSTMD